MKTHLFTTNEAPYFVDLASTESEYWHDWEYVIDSVLKEGFSDSESPTIFQTRRHDAGFRFDREMIEKGYVSSKVTRLAPGITNFAYGLDYVMFGEWLKENGDYEISVSVNAYSPSEEAPFHVSLVWVNDPDMGGLPIASVVPYRGRVWTVGCMNPDAFPDLVEKIDRVRAFVRDSRERKATGMPPKFQKKG